MGVGALLTLPECKYKVWKDMCNPAKLICYRCRVTERLLQVGQARPDGATKLQDSLGRPMVR